MSIIRDSVLADASLGFAPKAAASELFDLAERGFVTIGLLQRRGGAVRITRTAKRADGLGQETVYLLRALFGTEDAAGKTVVLTRHEQIPVAQSIAAFTRRQLLAEGAIKKLTPRTLRRSILAALWVVALSVSITLIATFHRPQVWAAYGVLTALAWVAVSGFVTGPLRRRGVLRTAKSKARFTMLNALRSSCSYGGVGPTDGPAKPLAYELMWTGYLVPYSVNAGHYDQKPAWCESPWPGTRRQIGDALDRTHKAIANALAQPYVKYKGYEHPKPDSMTYEVLHDLYQDLSQDAGGLGDGGHDGSDGHGGDHHGGGYDSDSSGGDGHGGDGGDGSGGDGGGDGGHG